MAPSTMYDFARNFEKAIDELAGEIEALKKTLAKPGSNKDFDREAVGEVRSNRWT